MPPFSLTDLQQRIAQHERELQALRQELESRQGLLTELTQRKEELQNQLRQVEEEIAALVPAAPATAERPEPAAPTAPLKPSSAGSSAGQPRLGELILTILRESARPMTARQLSEEARRRGFHSASRNPVQSVEARLQELKNQGIVQRASGQPGYLLALSANGVRKVKGKPSQAAKANMPKAAAKPAKSGPAAKMSSGKESVSNGAVQTAKREHRGGQPPLRVVLTDILKSSRKPLSGSELAQRALAAGYKSNSKNFVDSVWAMLGQMDNVEHLPHQGYRLKKN
jgi:hypothetical protein